MSVYIRIPIFTRREGALDERLESFDRWHDDSANRIAEKFDPEVNYKFLMPSQELLLSGNVKVSYPIDKTAEVPKGLVIRLELLALLDYIDSTKGVHSRNSSYFVMIDGSGAFDYDSIEKVLDKLINEHHSVVLGRRPANSADWFMGDPWRKDIELFEKFLIQRKYKDEISFKLEGMLPDAQAGCWGINLGIQKYLSLTAPGFELEFDLITSALTLPVYPVNLSIGFTEDLIRGTRPISPPRSYSSEDTSKTISKLGFMLHKLCYSKEELRGLLEAYRDDLPELYKTDVENFINQ